MEIDISINYTPKQNEIFSDDSKIKIISKGRRFGLTRGMANYCVERMLEEKILILWVDTIFSNIQRYVERYFMPVLKTLPKNMYKYNTQRSELKIGQSIIDFRSSDNPENIEGFGYNLIIINEAGIVLKNRKIWQQSILPMMMDYSARAIIGGTPKGKHYKEDEHLFWELYQKAQDKPGWKAFHYSTYDNPLLKKEDIEELEQEIPGILRRQEISGDFIDALNETLIKREWWKYYDPSSWRNTPVLKTVQVWDTAFKKGKKNDYSCGITIAIKPEGFYLIDMIHKKMEYPELKREIEKYFYLHGANELLIEDHASGQSIIQDLQETRIPIRAIKHKDDKITRAVAITPIIECGKFYLPEGYALNEKIISEAEDFPNGLHDDIVDAISSCLLTYKNVNSNPRFRTIKILKCKRKLIKNSNRINRKIRSKIK